MSEASTERIPLSRNRNYNILWVSLLFSEFTNAVVAIAFPLIVLATTGSVGELSVVLTVLAAASMAANVPAGVVADRWDRKKVMLVCQAVRIASLVGLSAAVSTGWNVFLCLIAVAVVEGVAGSVFAPAEDASLPQVVPSEQLSQAVARNAARPFVANLLGPVAAGLLFGLDHVLPLLLSASLLLCSFVALLFLVLPRHAVTGEDEEDEEEFASGGIGAEFGRGFWWVAGQRVIRTTLVWLIFTQLFFNALVVIVLTTSDEQDLAPGLTGLTIAFYGAGGLLGAVFAAKLVELLPSSVIVIGFSCVGAVLTALMAFVPAGIPLGLLFGGIALFVPAAATTVMTYQMIATPNALRGRLSGIVGLGTEGAGALGPLVGALLVTAVGGVASHGLLVCAACLGVVAVGSLLSPTLRRFPSVRGMADESA